MVNCFALHIKLAWYNKCFTFISEKKIELLINKNTSIQVGQQCKENIFAIQTLRDFQHVDEGKDQGINVREKAKQLVLLLRDEERLRNERARALKAKERFAQTASAFGSDTTLVSYLFNDLFVII